MNLKIAIVSDPASWMRSYISKLAGALGASGHSVIVSDRPEYSSADVAFFLSYSRIVSTETLAKARSNVVVHGSALPEGKGWSPWSWQILEGRKRLALTLFEAVDGVDSGPIYDQRWIELEGHELVDEWQAKQAEVTIEMCSDFTECFPGILSQAKAQAGSGFSYPRRRPDDSRLDPHRSLAEQFGLLRIVDNTRYPAYFELNGHTYNIRITKRDEEEKR